MTYPDLERPASVGDAQWEVIERLLQRIATARSGGDHELTVGSAKELIECVAKIVLDARGIAFGNATSFPKLVNAAHATLDRQPGTGLAMDPPVRDIAQAVKQVNLRTADSGGSLGW